MSTPPAAPTRPIYLDYHATTPVDPRVADVIQHALLDAFGNANSVDHAYGDEARALVEAARREVGALIGAEPAAVLFAGSAAEALAAALTDARAAVPGPLRVVATPVEHRALRHALERGQARGDVEVQWLDVDGCARIDLAELEAMAATADLVCVMAANNEVGTLYPVPEVAAAAHRAGARVLIDATQAAGKVPLEASGWGTDYLVLSAHKLYGPKGVGALVTGAEVRARPGWGTRDVVVGTANVPGIAGFGEACRLRRLEMREDEARVASLRDRLEERLRTEIPGLSVSGDRARRLAGNLHICVPGVPNDAVVARLRTHVALSTGSACTSGAQEPSHVLRAMRFSDDHMEGALRIGLGKFTTPEEVERAADHIVSAVDGIRAAMRRPPS